NSDPSTNFGSLICSAGSGTVGAPVKLDVQFSNEFLTVGGAGNLTIAKGITGSGAGVTKTGAGKTILSGTSTYDGTTTVSAGTLQVDGTLAGAVVMTGGTLGGSGTVVAITATTGATVALGLSTATSPITLTSNSDADLTNTKFAPVISGTGNGAS